MPRSSTYAEAGVDRNLRVESKKALKALKKTYVSSHYGKIIDLPYGKIFPFRNFFLDLIIEGVGTKVLIAQLANKFDTIGIDGIAMAVNDVIRSGAQPLAISDNIHIQISDPTLISELMNGIVKGAQEAQCPVPSGEIGDVAELIRGVTEGYGFDMVIAAIGVVAKEEIISGTDIEPGNAIVGLRSSGLHSNGISLARKVLFKEWGGRFDSNTNPEGLNRTLIEEALEPTRIYVKPFIKAHEKIKIKGAIHITGDGYLKFDKLAKFSKNIGFEFDNFEPQPIFNLIQETSADLGARISDEEMFKTFNMGWGFALIIDKENMEEAINILKRAGCPAQEIGQVTRSRGIKIFYKNRKIKLSEDLPR